MQQVWKKIGKPSTTKKEERHVFLKGVFINGGTSTQIYTAKNISATKPYIQ
jgi:hypothetical protein